MNLELVRYGSIPNKGTFGELKLGSIKVSTLEREWLNNAPMVSCVPVGEYTLEHHESKIHGQTWALVSHDLGVYHFEDVKAKRTAILIHAANRMEELEGCIGVGMYLGAIGQDWAVMDSKRALKVVLDSLRTEDSHKLTIRWANG